MILESRDVEFIENKFSHDFTIELDFIVDQPCVLIPPLIIIKGKSL